VRRRRLTARGVQPVGLVQHPFGWVDVDGAGAPATGERCFLARPSLKADACPILVDAFAQRMRGPDNVGSLWLPPRGPELNPLERLWRDLKADLAWQRCPDLEAQQAHVAGL
jgi:hypothetical protein